MNSYERLAGLALRIESARLRPVELAGRGSWVRVTTVVCLSGEGQHGLGEDVTYSTADQRRLLEGFDPSCVEGYHTLASFSNLLETVPLWPRRADHEASVDYRRWAFESAALDLALRQSGNSLAGQLGLEPRPVRFVVSMGLGEPAATGPILRLLERFPWMRFKLDANPTWNEALLRELSALDVVEVVDFKGAYRGTPVDQQADPALYRRVAEYLPRVWLEDPALDDATSKVLEPHMERVTWDAPIHHIDDIEALPYRPRTLNFKPSRFGRLQALFDAYDHCRDLGTILYGGGQFELDVGRDQLQRLASLFHPDTCNDVAPVAYHAAEPPAVAPRSPLPPPPPKPGFCWNGA